MEFDIGKDLSDAYEEGYINALKDLENKAEKELSGASWYSKGSFLKLIRRSKENFRGGNANAK